MKPTQRCIFCEKVIGGKTNDNKSGLCHTCNERIKDRIEWAVKKATKELQEQINGLIADNLALQNQLMEIKKE